MAELMKLKELLPNFYDGVYDMDVIVNVEQPLLDNFQTLIDQARNNHYAAIANEDGISMFEAMLGITNVVGQDIETRRYNVIMQLLPPKPVTMAYMRELMSVLNIGATLTVDTSKLHVNVEARTSDKAVMQRLSVLLKRLLPANMTFTTFNLLITSTTGTVSTGTDALYNTTIINKGGSV